MWQIKRCKCALRYGNIIPLNIIASGCKVSQVIPFVSRSGMWNYSCIPTIFQSDAGSYGRFAGVMLSHLYGKCYRNFSTKKKPPPTDGESSEKSATKDSVSRENGNSDEKTSEYSNESKLVDIKSLLDSTSRVIFQVISGDIKQKPKFGRQAQNGKIRRKPIPIKENLSDVETNFGKLNGQSTDGKDSNGAEEKQHLSEERGPENSENIDANSQVNAKSDEKSDYSENLSKKHDEDFMKSPPAEYNSNPVHFTLPILHFSSSNRFHALPALALYRKPAFPGFYQVLQIQDQNVLNCLSHVKQNSGHDYIGGFLTKSDKSKDPNGHSLPVLREDAGAVASYEEFHLFGTLLQIITITPNLSFQGGQVILMPHKRIRMTGIHAEPSDSYPLYRVAVEYVEDTSKQLEDSNVTKALHLEIIATVKELIKTSNFYKEHFDQIIRYYNLDYPSRLADLIAGISLAKRDQLQNILAELDINKRLSMVLEVSKHDLEFAKVQVEVKNQIEEKLSKEQRRYILTEQMKMIKKELGMDSDEKSTVIESFEEEFAKVMKYMPEEAISSFNAGISRLQQLEPSSAEFGVCRSYLEWLVGFPWGKVTVESTDIYKAKEILNSHHFGLNDVKTRLLEYMATSILNGQSDGKIICLVGPPGVGKTSIAVSMAEALNRKLYRFSLGGVFDVAELRGHRRTYVGALPGKFVQALKYTNAINPLIILDEIDKLGRDARGDPASALLEVLDPSQNKNFRDHYLDIPIDLSKVLFICTANTTDTIPVPLLDRMEIITIPGYLPEEKLNISKNFLIPQIQKSTGLTSDVIIIEDDAIDHIIKHYSREAGVRNLLKCIEKIHRKVALNIVMEKMKELQHNKQVLECADNPDKIPSDATKDVKSGIGNFILSGVKDQVLVTGDLVQSYLGVPLYTRETLHPYPLPYGVVMGLAWTNAGGATMYVEAHGQMVDKMGNLIEPNRSSSEELSKSANNDIGDMGDVASNIGVSHGSLKVTGHLGTVMTESSQIALTFCKTFLRKHQPKNVFLDEAHIHIHVPEGATPKDGPSGGITMASALISLAAKKRIKPCLAMTGELTLSGKVLRVGGIKEKLIAAIRECVENVVLPKANMADVAELDESIKNKVKIIFVDSFDEVYESVFEGSPGIQR